MALAEKILKVIGGPHPAAIATIDEGKPAVRFMVLTGFDKMAYGEIELTHRYNYHANGKLSTAEITDIDGELTMVLFDQNGNPA